MLRKFGVVLISGLLTILTILVLQLHASAQSPINLQADIFRLRQQVNQLQAQVSQLSGRGGLRSNANLPAPRSSPRRSSELSDSQIVDQLATLAIEAKDRLSALEQRVARLEQRLK